MLGSIDAKAVKPARAEGAGDATLQGFSLRGLGDDPAAARRAAEKRAARLAGLAQRDVALGGDETAEPGRPASERIGWLICVVAAGVTLGVVAVLAVLFGIDL